MPGADSFTAADRAQLAGCGIPLAEAERQLALLAAPPRAVRLARPATLGDGIERIRPEEEPELLARAEEARRAGRFLKFVPASGAASRMFRSLATVAERFPDGDPAAVRAAAEDGDDDARQVLALCDSIAEMALGQELELRRPGSLAGLARAASDPSFTPLFELFFSPADGNAALATLPKALLPFHLAAGRSRTAFAEQLAEGTHYLRDASGTSRFHFTVAGEFRTRFDDELERARTLLDRDGSRLEVGFSEQQPSTHALALDENGLPARSGDGRLLLRPAGHGALLSNLAATGGDLVFVKNIDNLLPEARHREIARWKLLLAGKLLAAQAEHASGGAGDSGRRPWRVCGVVANSGEPGGGPFWVSEADGRTTLQIVEAAEVDGRDAAQSGIRRRTTHFNPVDLVVALRDPAGEPWDLARFVDPGRAFVAEKSEGGRNLRVYERPGLWNGAMAGWNTLFVEVPAWTFAPVKTVLDLARAEHLPTAP